MGWHQGTIGKVGINLNQALKNPQSSEYDPIVQAGDSIAINPFNNIVSIRLEGTRLGDLVDRKLTADTLLKISEFQTFNYSGRKSAFWYLKNNAGGFSWSWFNIISNSCELRVSVNKALAYS